MRDFSDQVKDTLTHLVDPVGLRTTPLLDALRSRQEGASRSRISDEVRRALLEAIDSLRPKNQTAREGRAGRDHEILRRRYVDGTDPSTV